MARILTAPDRVLLLIVPALFNRKSKQTEASPETIEMTDATSVDEETTESKGGSTRDKSEPTPKQVVHKKARPPKNPPMTAKEARARAKEARAHSKAPKPDKATKRQLAADRRAERGRISDGQDRGDPLFDKYHMPRDKGPERLLVRDIVDSRRNVGQVFFMVAIIVMFLNSTAIPALQTASLLGWLGIMVLFIIDSFFLVRRVKRIVWSRYPKTTQRKFSLGWYAISRSIMFRKLRMPRPRPGISPGMPEKELGKVFRA